MPSNIYGGNILILYGIFILPSILISLIIIKPDLKNGILSLSEEIKNAIQGRSTKLIEKDKSYLNTCGRSRLLPSSEDRLSS